MSYNTSVWIYLVVLPLHHRVLPPLVSAVSEISYDIIFPGAIVNICGASRTGPGKLICSVDFSNSVLITLILLIRAFQVLSGFRYLLQFDFISNLYHSINKLKGSQ